MGNSQSARRVVAPVLSVLWGVGVVEASGVPEFHAYLLPDTVVTGVDSVFTIDFWVDSTAQHFNGYAATIQWDPTILEYVSASEGPLFTDPDSFDCPFYNTIVFTSSTDSTVTYEHVILCAGYFADGPGVMSTFEFLTLDQGTSALSIVSGANHTFADSGAWVNPEHPTFPRQVVLHDAVVVVEGYGTGAEDPEQLASAPALAFFPNPTRAGGVFHLESSDGPVFLDVVDATGRRVLRRQWASAVPGTFRWSGRGAGGTPLASGIYFARLETASGTAVRKLVLLR